MLRRSARWRPLGGGRPRSAGLTLEYRAGGAHRRNWLRRKHLDFRLLFPGSHCLHGRLPRRKLPSRGGFELVKKGNVRFVLGPTQVTLPRYHFTERFKLVLLDGPHAYPFPDLEYYYFYPHIVTGGWLVIDDMQIPSIRRMVEILSADDMWHLEQTVGRTAFLRRTDAPTFCPTGDSWWEQGYNRPAVPPRH